MTISPDHAVADARPTKEFFVEMLTRDVRMVMAILDLVDNCIDGALRLRKDASLEGLLINLSFDQQSFSISDNCGGIPLPIARDYAFRFGRPPRAPNVDNSVGRFGVGMKRALFKLGQGFRIATTTIQESYNIEADVIKWLDDSEWTFVINDIQQFDSPHDEHETGTTIIVTQLTDEARQWFALQYNETNLRNEISKRHQHHIDRGVVISLNGITIPTTRVEFLVSHAPLLRPAYKAYDRGAVHVRVMAGVGQSSPMEAGWYVYCNGRMILDADRSKVTGWGEPGMIPRFHNQYARFRGAALFDSRDSTELPWNTTKDGVDEGVPVFAEAYGIMVTLMRPVIRFLDAMDRDNDQPDGSRALVELVERAAKPMPIGSLVQTEAFKYQTPPPPIPRGQRSVSIQYQKQRALVDSVMKSIGATSARAAGEMTFDYYVEQEGLDAS